MVSKGEIKSVFEVFWINQDECFRNVRAPRAQKVTAKWLDFFKIFFIQYHLFFILHIFHFFCIFLLFQPMKCLPAFFTGTYMGWYMAAKKGLLDSKFSQSHNNKYFIMCLNVIYRFNITRHSKTIDS